MSSKKVICLDAGHGGNDPGAVASGMREAEIAFDVVGILAGQLERAGLVVLLSRPNAQENPGINPRWQLANKQRVDYFVSIHVNAGRGTGVETFFYRASTDRSRRSEAFARCVNNTYASEIGLRNRGVKPDTQTNIGSIGVLRHTAMPAILVELAFIDSPPYNTDVFVLENRRFDMASALAKGIYAYLDIEHVIEPLPAPPTPKVNLDILGSVQEISGYIQNGATWVRLTELSAALGFLASWDDKRRIPVISATNDGAQPMLGSIDENTLVEAAEGLQLLKQLVHFEAQGEDEKGQILVANVIKNRINSPRFPNTLREVIFAPNAFTPTQRPDFGTAITSALTAEAVNKALDGIDYSRGATFFHSLSGITPEVWHERAVREGRLIHLFDHGGHRFYK